MDRELIFSLKTLKNKTGIETDVYSSSFTYLYSSGERIPFVYGGKHTEGLQDKKQDVTLFRFRFKQTDYYGTIRGSGAVERNYAMLICNYIENNGFGGGELTRKEFVKAVLSSEITGSQTGRYLRKFTALQVPCYVSIIKAQSQRIKEIIDFLDNFTINGADTAIAGGADSCLFVKFMTGDSDEFQSPSEFAEIFRRSLYEETGISVKIGIGGIVKSLADMPVSLEQAGAALKISAMFKAKSPVHSYREYMLYKILSDLSPSLLSGYYDTLIEGDAAAILEDEDMLETVEAFMDNNLNVSETARKLYMHRNTLTYRLDKIRRATGLDIRNFSDAITFNLCNLLHRILQKK